MFDNLRVGNKSQAKIANYSNVIGSLEISDHENAPPM